jgi:ketosteroid isomerase-like protein
MSIGKRFVIFVGLCLLLLTSAVGQARPPQSSEESKLFSLEKMWNQAQLQHDSGALKSMISDRFVSTEWDGELSSRDKFLDEIADPKFDPSLMSVQDMKVEFYNDTAIVIGVYHTKGKYNGKSYDHVGRFTDTWIRQLGLWKCIASHTSLLNK